MTLHDTTWMKQGACAGHDGDLWHPTGRGRPEEHEAKAICNTCPVQDACLEWALATNQQQGIWGGHTTPERQRIATTGNPQPRKSQPAQVILPPCGAPDCNQALPSRRHVYCSPACAKAGDRAKARLRSQRRRETADA